MRIVRLDIEEREILHLSNNASFSKNAHGFIHPREKDDIRTVFMQDRDRIIHSKYFRRLKDKAQVIMLNIGDFRTRLTHTLEVMQIARTIARALRLNEDLTEAAALGHDLGHSPFGHAGERAIRKYYPKFHHANHSLRVVEVLENGTGLNLSFEVRDAILKHTKGKHGRFITNDNSMPSTSEGIIVRIADSIAYINHDLDDAIRFGLLKDSDIPKDIIEILGVGYSKRIDTMIMSVVEESMKEGNISIKAEVEDTMMKLKAFMFERVYEAECIAKDLKKVEDIIDTIFQYLLKNIDIIHNDKMFNKAQSYKDDTELVKDYVAYLTDHQALEMYNKISF